MSNRFLQWLLQHPEEAKLEERPLDFKTIYDDYLDAIRKAGGSALAEADCLEAITKEMFDCGVEELFQALGVSKGEFWTLPKIVQKAYIMAMISAEEELKQQFVRQDQESQWLN